MLSFKAFSKTMPLGLLLPWQVQADLQEHCVMMVHRADQKEN